MIGHMDLNVPFTIKDHLTLDALVSLLLNSGEKKKHQTEINSVGQYCLNKKIHICTQKLLFNQVNGTTQ